MSARNRQKNARANALQAIRRSPGGSARTMAAATTQAAVPVSTYEADTIPSSAGTGPSSTMPAVVQCALRSRNRSVTTAHERPAVVRPLAGAGAVPTVELCDVPLANGNGRDLLEQRLPPRHYIGQRKQRCDLGRLSRHAVSLGLVAHQSIEGRRECRDILTGHQQ